MDRLRTERDRGRSERAAALLAPPDGGPPGRVRPGLRAGGFTIVELLVVLVLMSVVMGIASQGYNEYLDRSVPQRAADAVGGYIAQTRSHAVQRRLPVTLAINRSDRSLTIRTETDTLRKVNLGEGAEIELSELSSTFDGDSLTFNGRGLCSVCGIAGKAITVAARGTSYEVTVVALGRWKSTLKE